MEGVGSHAPANYKGSAASKSIPQFLERSERSIPSDEASGKMPRTLSNCQTPSRLQPTASSQPIAPDREGSQGQKEVELEM